MAKFFSQWNKEPIDKIIFKKEQMEGTPCQRGKLSCSSQNSCFIHSVLIPANIFCQLNQWNSGILEIRAFDSWCHRLYGNLKHLFDFFVETRCYSLMEVYEWVSTEGAKAEFSTFLDLILCMMSLFKENCSGFTELSLWSFNDQDSPYIETRANQLTGF